MNLELIVRLQEEAVAQKALGRRGLASLIQEAVDALLKAAKA